MNFKRLVYYFDFGENMDFVTRSYFSRFIHASIYGPPPLYMCYNADTVITTNENGEFIWFKHKNTSSELLTSDELKRFTMQQLQSTLYFLVDSRKYS